MEIDPEDKEGGNLFGLGMGGGDTGMEGMTNEIKEQSDSLFNEI